MSLRAIATDLNFGWVRVRLELIPITLGIAGVSGFAYGISFLLAVAAHELGHYAAARALDLSGDKLILQVTGGGSYIRESSDARRRILVLLAGPFAGLLLASFALTLNAIGLEAGMYELFYSSTVWTIYQLMPFPPLDGGQLLRIALTGRVKSATLSWRLGWVLGLILAAGFVLIDLGNLQPVVLLTGMALILGRAESGYVRHLDAYAAWERGDHRAVLAAASKVPDYVDKEDKQRLLELAMFSAIELGDAAEIEKIAVDLPAHRPVTMSAAEWLLARGHAYGAKIAQRALDGLDQELAKLSREDRERLADLTVAFASFEARELRHESALGLLERAVDLGFSHPARIQADGDLRALAAHPRLERVLARASGERT